MENLLNETIPAIFIRKGKRKKEKNKCCFVVSLPKKILWFDLTLYLT
jgi:hypothetical protein